MDTGNKKNNNLQEKKLGTKIQADLYNNVLSNPISQKSIQSVNTTTNRLYGGYNQTNRNFVNTSLNEILHLLNIAMTDKENLAELFYSIHHVFINSIQNSFSAIGLYNKQSQCINLKLVDRIGSTFSSKILLSNTENPIVKCFNQKQQVLHKDSSFLNAVYIQNMPVNIFPLVSGRECLGIFMTGGLQNEIGMELYKFVANYIAIFAQNKNLSEMVEKNTDVDLLTGLMNHKSLQEKINEQISITSAGNGKLAVCIFDILNISQINRDIGYAKGDEVIKIVAQKISENSRNTDFLGRYGGDEIAVVMPNTSNEEARYIAEYLSYIISCINVDDVGPIRVSAGIATYPDSSINQEKLMILTEQAMCISKGKSYQSGNSVIVTSEDVDFWDDNALKSFAEVLMKRHAQVGISFEDELVKKFHSEKIISNQHMLDVVTSLAGTIDAKDTYTKGHSTSVSRYSEALARALNLPEQEVERIRLGAMLHDIGKIGIPENVLRKPTMLNDDEWEIMKQHPTIGADKVLSPIESLRDLIPMVKYHHEHWDGSGYPEGLKGEDIPLTARIVSIADAYHALISDRPYRKGLTVQRACEILRLGAGIQWDRELVRQFITIAPSLATSV